MWKRTIRSQNMQKHWTHWSFKGRPYKPPSADQTGLCFHVTCTLSSHEPLLRVCGHGNVHVFIAVVAYLNVHQGLRG